MLGLWLECWYVCVEKSLAGNCHTYPTALTQTLDRLQGLSVLPCYSSLGALKWASYYRTYPAVPLLPPSPHPEFQPARLRRCPLRRLATLCTSRRWLATPTSSCSLASFYQSSATLNPTQTGSPILPSLPSCVVQACLMGHQCFLFLLLPGTRNQFLAHRTWFC